MKLLLVATAFLLSTSVPAGELAETFEKLADSANIANGDAYVGTYKKKGFKVWKEAKKLRKEWNEDANNGEEDACQYNVTIGRRNAYRVARNVGEHDGVGEALKKLYKQRKLKTAITIEWDEESGDSEYCQINEVRVYGKDGDLLVLEYNFTT